MPNHTYPRRCERCTCLYSNRSSFAKHQTSGACDSYRQGKSEEYIQSELKRLTESIFVRKSESFYQQVLETRYAAGHVTLSTGVTDVTTPDMHIEIKRACDWLGGLRQLLSYHFVAPRTQLRLYLFDYNDLPPLKREMLLASFKKQTHTGIHLYVMDLAGREIKLCDASTFPVKMLKPENEPCLGFGAVYAPLRTSIGQVRSL